jgi:methylated-DNA-[protein]-cysteine S-methyltransferase
MSYHIIYTKIGLVGFRIEDKKITQIDFNPKINNEDQMDEFSSSVGDNLSAFIEGKIKKIDLPYELKGTEFQKKVLQAMRRIPFGSTVSYQELGIMVGSPNASQAIGSVCAFNPLPLIFPCHRVIQKNGKLGGFSGGIEIKKVLLMNEKAFSDLV